MGAPAPTPHVAVSWRGADYFEGEGDVDENAELIIVEPPSQLYAATRRRREPPGRRDENPDGSTVASDAAAASEAGASSEAEQESAGRPARKSRRALVLAVLLVLVAVGAWYFLVRDPGAGAAAPAVHPGSVLVAHASEVVADRIGLPG